MNGDSANMGSKAEESHPVLKYKWMTVNKRLLPVKGFYFFFVAAIGDLLPFIAIYMKHLGLSSGETGIIYGVMAFVSFIARPLVGALADRLQRHKLVLTVVCICTGIFYMLLLVVPRKPHLEFTTPVRLNIHCNTLDSYIRDCKEYVNSKEKCQLTFTEYANLTMKKIQPVVNSSLDNKTSGYRIVNEKSQVIDDIKCRASCSFSLPGAYQSKVCFARDVSSSTNRKCVRMWVSSSSNSHLTMVLLNVSEVMQHEIPEDRVSEPHLHCRNYDLKWLEHEEKLYYQMTCDKASTLHCDLLCNKPVNSKCSQTAKDRDTFDLTFWLFFCLYFLAHVSFAPTFSLIDAITYDTLGKERYRWGFQRLFGTVGFALFAVTSTFIMDHMVTQDKDIDYSISFYIFGVLCVIAAINSCFLQTSADLKCSEFVKNVCKLFTYFYIVAYLVMATIFGTWTGAIEGFLFWYLQDLGCPQIVLGLCLAVNCTAEVICLFFSGFIIKKIGHIPCMYLAFVAYAIRFLGYSFLVNPWYALLIEPIHGVNFGILYSAMSSYASVIAPPGMQATMQGLLGGLHFGVGKGIGSFLTGYLFEVFGERWTFRAYAISAGVLLVIYILLNFFVIKYPASSNNKMVELSEKEGDSSTVQDSLMGPNGDSSKKTDL